MTIQLSLKLFIMTQFVCVCVLWICVIAYFLHKFRVDLIRTYKNKFNLALHENQYPPNLDQISYLRDCRM